MSIAMLERGAQELAPFLDEVAFLGGATIALWITDEAAPGPRVTKDAAILGFENQWQRPALDHAKALPLPSGRRIPAIPPPYLVATKLEAWKGRGEGDHLRSHDLEDIVTLVDGRAEIVDEVKDASSELRSFLSHEVGTLLDQSRFLDLVDGTVVGFGRGGSGDADRVDDIVLPRLRALADIPTDRS
jgi:hypothetical protein